MENKVLAYANHFRRFYSQMFQPVAVRCGLSQLEIDILLFLHNNPSFNTARDIVERRGVAKSNVSTAVESLRARGYLSAVPDARSRKVQRLTVLPAARDVLQALSACQRQCFATLLEGFTAEERRTLSQLLQRLDDNVVSALERLESTEGRL